MHTNEMQNKNVILIQQHLRVISISDFTSFRGMLVLGGNQVSFIMDYNLVTEQSRTKWIIFC